MSEFREINLVGAIEPGEEDGRLLIDAIKRSLSGSEKGALGRCALKQRHERIIISDMRRAGIPAHHLYRQRDPPINSRPSGMRFIKTRH